MGAKKSANGTRSVLAMPDNTFTEGFFFPFSMPLK